MEEISETHKVEIGNCTLYFGDCYDVLKELDTDSVTLVHSDPPYIIHSGSQKSDWYDKIGVNKQLDKLKNADISDGFDMNLVLSELERICKCPNYQLWCSKKQFPKLLNYAIDKGYSWQDIMLYRNNALPNVNGEYKDKVTGYNWNIGGKKEWNHPALKPVEPIVHMLKTGSDEGDVVLDMFMGSGTTGEACVKTGRKFVGIEKNPEYFDMAVKRIKKLINSYTNNLF